MSAASASIRLLHIREVTARTSVPASTIYRLIKAGKFPRSVPLGFQRVAWIEREVDDWIAARIEAARTGEAG